MITIGILICLFVLFIAMKCSAAQIVCIAKETLNEKVNSIGDIVSIHDDNVELGPSYDGFTIYQIPGLTADEARAKLFPDDCKSEAKYKATMSPVGVVDAIKLCTSFTSTETKLEVLGQCVKHATVEEVKK